VAPSGRHDTSDRNESSLPRARPPPRGASQIGGWRLAGARSAAKPPYPIGGESAAFGQRLGRKGSAPASRTYSGAPHLKGSSSPLEGGLAGPPSPPSLPPGCEFGAREAVRSHRRRRLRREVLGGAARGARARARARRGRGPARRVESGGRC